MNQYLINRRRFIRNAMVTTAGAVAVSGLGSTIFAQVVSGVSIIVDPADKIANSAQSQWAVGQLKQAVEDHGVTVKLCQKISQAPSGDILVVVSSGTSKFTEKIGATVPKSPESFALINRKFSRHSVVLASGSDARGMIYALLELTDRVLYHDSVQAACTIPSPIIEQTKAKIRCVHKPFANTTEDLPEFYDKAFWDEYLTMLATERFNRLQWGTGQVSNFTTSTTVSIKDGYFAFPYPYFVDIGGVTVSNVSAAQRTANLEMLKYISDGCALRGLDFTFGIWNSNFYVKSEKYNIEGLSGDLGGSQHTQYSQDALSAILAACPNITGLTFRVHYEGGIPPENSIYWKKLFSAVTPFVNQGRKIEIDMHGKNVVEEHLQAVLDSKATAVISPKKTAEQSGLPYHHASIRKNERNSIPDPPTKLLIPGTSRYGYSNFLQEGRRWGVVHRLWPGTQRQLLWGDPAFAAGFGRAAYFCGSDGIEWYEPLSFHGRGGTGELGDKTSYSDTSLKPSGYAFHKFLYTYRVWGRCIYNPNTDPGAWKRFLDKRFGKGADAMEIALGNASRVIMLASTIQAASASWLDFWPEVFEGLNITDGMPIHPTKDCMNPQRLTSTFDPQLFAEIDLYAEALLTGNEYELDKYTPLEVATWWENMSNTALSKIKEARSLVLNTNDAEFRRYDIDIRIMAHIGLYYGRKWRAAILYSIYRKTNDTKAKKEAVAMYTSAIEAWQQASEIGSVYKPFPQGKKQSGVWSDRTPLFIADRDAMAAIEFTTVTEITTHPGPATTAIVTAKSTPSRPAANALHTPPTIFSRGSALNLVLETDTTTQSAKLYYRRVYQAENWNVIDMNKMGNQFYVSIPAVYTQTDFPLQYYFALKKGANSVVLFPGFDSDVANQPYFDVRSVKA